MTDTLTYEDVLHLLSEKASAGSVSALVCLERALRPGQQPKAQAEFDAEFEDLLADLAEKRRGDD